MPYKYKLSNSNGLFLQVHALNFINFVELVEAKDFFKIIYERNAHKRVQVTCDCLEVGMGECRR